MKELGVRFSVDDFRPLDLEALCHIEMEMTRLNNLDIEDNK